MSDEPVDVLIIGAGASGAAVAWSLADTRMRILCLEQGDWVNSAEFPSTKQDWEVQQFKDFNIDPNVRAHDTDYPINNDNSPISVVNFNGVGGGTILYAAHFPRLHPSDFKVKSLDGVADDWPVDYDQLEPYFALNDRKWACQVSPVTRLILPSSHHYRISRLAWLARLLRRVTTNWAGTGGHLIVRLSLSHMKVGTNV